MSTCPPAAAADAGGLALASARHTPLLAPKPAAQAQRKRGPFSHRVTVAISDSPLSAGPMERREGSVVVEHSRKLQSFPPALPPSSANIETHISRPRTGFAEPLPFESSRLFNIPAAGHPPPADARAATKTAKVKPANGSQRGNGKGPAAAPTPGTRPASLAPGLSAPAPAPAIRETRVEARPTESVAEAPGAGCSAMTMAAGAAPTASETLRPPARAKPRGRRALGVAYAADITPVPAHPPLTSRPPVVAIRRGRPPALDLSAANNAVFDGSVVSVSPSTADPAASATDGGKPILAVREIRVHDRRGRRQLAGGGAADARGQSSARRSETPRSNIPDDTAASGLHAGSERAFT